MPEDLFDEPERRAAERLAVARQFVARGKLRDALDALNVAIQLAPGNPQAFRQRAEVFELMGLLPQAEADRRRADELAAAMPPPPAPPAEDEPSPSVGDFREGEEIGEGEEAEESEEPETARAPASRPLPESWESGHDYGPVPGDIPREASRGPGLGPLLFTVAVIVLFLTVVGAGALLAVDRFGDDDGPSPSRTPVGPTGAAGGGGTGTPTLVPTPYGSPSMSGSPYSLADLVAAWKAKGMTVQTGAAGQGFSGFRAPPSEVTMSRGGSTATAAVFVYDTAGEAQVEWDLVAGSRPVPKGSRTLPSHATAWWNANVVVVVLSDPGGLGSDALDGLINLGG